MRFRLSNSELWIIHERAGVISDDPIWICFEDCYMYEHDSLIGLLWKVITEWRHDRHMVG